MVKTHPYSKFVLKSLEEIRECSNVILQTEQTNSTFTESNKTAYLCEVVPFYKYEPNKNTEALSNEIIKLNAEIRRLRSRAEKAEKTIKEYNIK